MYKFHWIPAIDLHHPRVRKVLSLMGPRVLTVFFIQLVLISLTDNIASWLAPGSVSALVYGWLFMQVPETLVGTAIGTVLLPTISEQIAREQHGCLSPILEPRHAHHPGAHHPCGSAGRGRNPAIGGHASTSTRRNRRGGLGHAWFPGRS